MKIVQIGTCVGNDDLTEITQMNDPELLVLVEPMSIHNNKIKECYSKNSNVVIENIAITTSDQEEMVFYYHKEDGPKYEVATSDINHILKHGYDRDGVVELKVKCVKINDLFDKYNLINIDILFIDAEGLDDQIIRSIDFLKYNINKIYFENLHLKDENIYKFLSKLGYKITKKMGHNDWTSLAEKSTKKKKRFFFFN
ncbi:FkbM family methyltransferase [uncultured Flavobacterium sp.]|uniref:FkbM family methyltransferase n=1 Tax=uncultured Flavobacterium sp. TaxID=165435 RepID=UPI0030C88745